MADPAAFLDLLARAELRSAAGDWAEAAELWDHVTAANPVHGDYWARLAEARFAGQDYAAAGLAYQKVLELGVRPEYLRDSGGDCLDRAGRPGPGGTRAPRRPSSGAVRRCWWRRLRSRRRGGAA